MKTEIEKSGHSVIDGSAFRLRSKSDGGQAGVKSSAFLSAFTLVELMIALAMFGLTMAGAIGVYVMCQKLWQATALGMATSRDGNMALSRLVYGVGSNNGLRTAASIVYEDMKGMWTGTDHVYPPAPGDKDHFLNNGASDGSWRIISYNTFDGVRCIDFNKEASNIVVWAEPAGGSGAPGSVAERETRQLICNYVSDAFITNNASGVSIQLTIIQRKGRYTSTNQIGTFVKRRN